MDNTTAITTTTNSSSRPAFFTMEHSISKETQSELLKNALVLIAVMAGVKLIGMVLQKVIFD